MKCPKCGGNLRQSKKDPNYGLCDNCRKRYKWSEKPISNKKISSKNSSRKAPIISIIIIGFIILAFIYILTPKKQSDEYVQQADSYLEQISTLGESYQGILDSQNNGEISTDEFMSQMGEANLQMMELTSDVLSLKETGYSKKIGEIGNLYSDLAREIMNYVNLNDSSAADNISSITSNIVSKKAELNKLREQIKKSDNAENYNSASLPVYSLINQSDYVRNGEKCQGYRIVASTDIKDEEILAIYEQITHNDEYKYHTLWFYEDENDLTVPFATLDDEFEISGKPSIDR